MSDMTDREIELLLGGMRDNMASVREQVRDGFRSVRDEVRERTTGIHARLDRMQNTDDGHETRIRDVETAVSGISSAASSSRSWVATLIVVVGLVISTVMSALALMLH